MSHKNILIPFGKESKDLKALYHALSLARRIPARLFVLSLEEATDKKNRRNPVVEACRDVVHNACESGLQISFHMASDSSESEFLEFLKSEYIDLIIISNTEISIEKMIRSIMSMISCQVVQVKEKNAVNFIL